MKGIKSEAKRKHQSDSNLPKSLCELEASIAKKDEEDAIKLGHTWRKFFGYIQMCNITQDLNIVLFNESSVRIYHELSRHDIIYIDATRKLFSDEYTNTNVFSTTPWSYEIRILRIHQSQYQNLFQVVTPQILLA